MRLASLDVTGFRGFTTRHAFDLQAETIILIGANGQGKTSLFDAILWGLTGRVQRFSGDDKLLSLFSDTGTMQVVLTLGSNDDPLVVRRTFDGKQQRLRVQDSNGSVEGSMAESRLLQRLWPGVGGVQQNLNLESALVRGIYLQQDRLRDFIEAADESARFAAVSELIGTGRLNELQVQLDNARSAWTRATNVRTNEAEAGNRRLRALESQLLSLTASAPDISEVRQRWTAWWSAPQISTLWKRGVPAPDSTEASTALDHVLKQLQTSTLARERRLTIAENLATEMEKRSKLKPPESLDVVTKEHSDLRKGISEASVNLATAQQVVAEERRKQVVESSVREELKALAQIALRHLEDRCPVCDQTYDREQTRARLQTLLAETTPMPPVQREIVSAAAAQLATLEKELAALEKVLNETRRTTAELEGWNAELQRRLQELGITESTEGVSKLVGILIDELRAENVLGRKLLDEGEKLALLIGRAEEEGRRYELQRQIESLRGEQKEIENLLESRNRTAEEATRILDSLRDAATDIVEDEIRRLEPLLQRIYSRIDPHPAFRVVRLLSKFAYRRGRVSVSVEDPIYDISSDDPGAILSSSQLNSLALSLFLSLNLGIGALPLDALLLDDPLQTLDNVNLLGVIDLLRRAKGLRQLIISTHDQRFGRLLERKLRPVNSEQKTRVFELEGWTREGPSVRQHDAETDIRPLKIAV